MSEILVKGENYWRLCRSRRVALLVDAENYFAALHQAMINAERSIFIVGWDVHSELRLVRGETAEQWPDSLGPLLDELARRCQDLNIYILNWDFAMLYALEREFFPRYKLRWKSHDRVHFCLDGNHPIGASQHQKIVVIDDCLAFTGGMDLSKWRWDTREHRAEDERRLDPEGEPYPPFHDVQMLVDGETAAALGELVRRRWRDAGGGCDPVVANPEADSDPWPSSVRPDFEQVSVAIARTLSAQDEGQGCREVEKLYLDTIAAARGFIYIENQYLSSRRVGQALARRLAEPGGPEVVIVMPRETGGWLEQHTMDVLRARLLQELHEADCDDRLRVYYPRVATEPLVSVMVHAKVMVIDDMLLRVGSSNLSNRSMGLDSECDLLIDAGAEAAHRGAIADFRRGLLAEHLGVEPAAVARAEQQQDSLIAAIESLREGERSLEPLVVELSEDLDRLVPESELIDPESPVAPKEMLSYLIGDAQQERAFHHALRVVLLVLAVIGMAAAWRWTPLSEWLDLERLTVAGEWLADSAYTPVLVPLIYVLGSLLVLPITLIIIATVTVFGPWWGLAYALVGAELAAVVAFLIGRWVGRDAVSRIAGSQLNSVTRALSNRGVLTIITLRIVPVAPFTVINLIAGISTIRLRDFALGSLLGMVPGIAAIALLTDRIVASLRDPDTLTIVLLLVAAVVVGLGLFGLRRAMQRDS